MAEEKEELNIQQPEAPDQSDQATPDPSAPPTEKKGTTIGTTLPPPSRLSPTSLPSTLPYHC